MEHRLTRLIGEKALENGWGEIISKNKIGLENNSEIIEVQIYREKIRVKIVGGGGVLIKRENILANLRDKDSGQIKEGDEIWLLDQIAEGEFKRGGEEIIDGA